jgi:molecular chaperone HtpG
MTTETQPQIREFQSETKQILRLVIHSLYSHKEIFLRELISNASDACEKLRFESIANPELLGADALQIELVPDAAAGTLTVKDNGIGMSREEIADNLGTIARSGTKQFLESLSGDKAKDSQLIGQFGVGFYSAFIVASSVTVLTKRPGHDGVRWTSNGEGTYELAGDAKSDRGTEITLMLRDEEKQYLEASELRALVKKYSDHIGFPIVLREKDEVKTLNQATAFWTRPKNEIKPEDYQAFYKSLTHDWDEARSWAHHKIEGNLEYTSLLFLPKRAPFDLSDRTQQHGVQLYVKRVFIMDKSTELLPPWLRFMRGLVDCADLPLNVSRELLQNNRTVQKIKAALVKRSLDLIEDLANNKPEEYAEFWVSFGAVLKEGILEEKGEQQDRIAKLLRFHSTASAGTSADVSLEAYVARMPADQKVIYFSTADTLAAARSSPHLEGFRAKGFEVLLLTDRIDEWVGMHLNEFTGKKLENVARAGADIEAAIQTPDKAAAESTYQSTLERLKEALAGKIASARLSSRLTESPSCLIAGEHDISIRMARMVKQAGQMDFPGGLPIFELNAKHPLIERLKDTLDAAAFKDLAELLYDQAVLAEGGQLDDPAQFVRRTNKLILEGAAAPSLIVT